MTEYDGDQIGCVWDPFWKLASADVPAEILGTYLAARIVPGSKPNEGVRPFAIGQVIRRLVCKATAKLLTNKVRNVTRPHQYAVGMKQSLDLLHQIVSAHTKTEPWPMSTSRMPAVPSNGEPTQKEIEALDKNLWKWCAVLFKAGQELM